MSDRPRPLPCRHCGAWKLASEPAERWTFAGGKPRLEQGKRLACAGCKAFYGYWWPPAKTKRKALAAKGGRR